MAICFELVVNFGDKAKHTHSRVGRQSAMARCQARTITSAHMR